jgi:sulfur carrier protein ThiS
VVARVNLLWHVPGGTHQFFRQQCLLFETATVAQLCRTLHPGLCQPVSADGDPIDLSSPLSAYDGRALYLRRCSNQIYYQLKQKGPPKCVILREDFSARGFRSEARLGEEYGLLHRGKIVESCQSLAFLGTSNENPIFVILGKTVSVKLPTRESRPVRIYETDRGSDVMERLSVELGQMVTELKCIPQGQKPIAAETMIWPQRECKFALTFGARSVCINRKRQTIQFPVLVGDTLETLRVRLYKDHSALFQGCKSENLCFLTQEGLLPNDTPVFSISIPLFCAVRGRPFTFRLQYPDMTENVELPEESTVGDLRAKVKLRPRLGEVDLTYNGKRLERRTLLAPLFFLDPNAVVCVEFRLCQCQLKVKESRFELLVPANADSAQLFEVIQKRFPMVRPRNICLDGNVLDTKKNILKREWNKKRLEIKGRISNQCLHFMVDGVDQPHNFPFNATVAEVLKELGRGDHPEFLQEGGPVFEDRNTPLADVPLSAEPIEVKRRAIQVTVTFGSGKDARSKAFTVPATAVASQLMEQAKTEFAVRDGYQLFLNSWHLFEKPLSALPEPRKLLLMRCLEIVVAQWGVSSDHPRQRVACCVPECSKIDHLKGVINGTFPDS